MSGKRLLRSRTERMWGGVCGGFAEYFKVDPVLVRLVWIVFTIAAFPVGLVGYIVCLVVMPEAPIGAPSTAAASSGSDVGGPTPSAPMGSATPSGSGTHPGMVGGLILVVVGALLLLGNLELFDWGALRYLRWRYLWPMALIIIGIVMLLRALRPKPAR